MKPRDAIWDRTPQRLADWLEAEGYGPCVQSVAFVLVRDGIDRVVAALLAGADGYRGRIEPWVGFTFPDRFDYQPGFEGKLAFHHPSLKSEPLDVAETVALLEGLNGFAAEDARASAEDLARLPALMLMHEPFHT